MRGGGHLAPQVANGGDPHLGRYAKVWNSAVFARKLEALVSKAEFTAAEKKVTYIANFNGRLERRRAVCAE